jgi:predicted ArsR family transcriptional regulator
MILARILEFLAQREFASLGEIARAVGSPPEAVRDMLKTLSRKGRVQQMAARGACASACRQCVQRDLELYRLGGATPGVGAFDCAGGAAK